MPNEPPTTILHIEDNEANRYVVARLLQNAGFTVIQAVSGAEGIQLAIEQSPDLVILDVKLPDLDGFEVCRRLKSNLTTASIPVLHLSASFVDSRYKVQGLDSGADAYLAQPVAPIELLATVRSLLRIRQAEVKLAQLLLQEQQARQQSSQIADRITRLQAITAALSRALTMSQVAEVVVTQGIAALGATGGVVSLLNSNGTEFTNLYIAGCSQTVKDTWSSYPANASLPIPDAVRSREPVLLESSAACDACYPQLAALQACTGTEALAAIPLLLDNHPLGGLGFSFTTARQFNQDDRTFLLALAQQTAQALERSQLYDQAQESNRMKDEFLAILSHELRSPLNAILGWAQLLRTKTFDAATITHALETIERNAQSQAQLIDDLLDVARMIRGKLRLETHPINLVSVIEASISTVHLAAESKNIQLHKTLDTSLEPVLGDRNRLQQIVWNLLSNAVKFTPPGGRVDIILEKIREEIDSSGTATHPSSPIPTPTSFTRKPREYAQIRVSDTGQGISPEFLPYVFDRFRQADSTTTRPQGGLGLGLSIVRQLVELHGGTVAVESPGKGQGATFTVRLPLHGDEGRDIKNEPQKPSLTTHSPSLPLVGMRVLIVDDEADTRDLLMFLLEQQGALVSEARSASEALEKMEQVQPDLLVSDIAMPNEDGYSLIRQLRQLESKQIRHVPAIALTAYAEEEARQQALTAGFQMHVPKPIDPINFTTAIVNLISKKDLL